MQWGLVFLIEVILYCVGVCFIDPMIVYALKYNLRGKILILTPFLELISAFLRDSEFPLIYVVVDWMVKNEEQNKNSPVPIWN